MKPSDVKAMQDVEAELIRARANHWDMNSAHEGYAILLEEVHELWDEVRRKDDQHDLARMRAEACQVAAMAIRFMTDICGEE
jgi:NTP pyrophosphatase (non-canonical NTP hydrolase)